MLGGIVRNVALLSVLVVPLLTQAAEPAEGTPLVVRRGFFTETNVGGLVNLGGVDAYSNLQTYLQLGVGYNIGQSVELGVHVGIGANAQNCYGQHAPNNDEVCLAEDGKTVLTDNFTMFFIDLSASYYFQVYERLYIAPKLMGGYTLLDPAPVARGDGSLVNGAINLGVGAGLEYATSMDHFSIGLDVAARMILGPGIISLQFYPRVKYTF